MLANFRAMAFIVELEKGVYLATWEGDPGRTLDEENAKQFRTLKSARKAIEKAKEYRPFKNTGVVCVG